MEFSIFVFGYFENIYFYYWFVLVEVIRNQDQNNGWVLS